MDIFGSSEAAKILVIDDRPLSRVMAVDLLSANGYDVIEHDGISDIFTTDEVNCDFFMKLTIGSFTSEKSN